jgi:hypothetical protein
MSADLPSAIVCSTFRSGIPRRSPALKRREWSGLTYVPPLDCSLLHYPAITADAKITMDFVDEVAALGRAWLLQSETVPNRDAQHGRENN